MSQNEIRTADLDGLSSRQEEALLTEGHCAVLAGPGSGKTRVLVSKVAHLLRHQITGPRGVACITYNNECVRELRKRFVERGLRPGGQLFWERSMVFVCHALFDRSENSSWMICQMT